jgi:hypothetical protein
VYPAFRAVGFLLNGNRPVGVRTDSLIVRLGEQPGEEALKEPPVSEFAITRGSMSGRVQTAPEGIEDDDQWSGWVQKAVKVVGKLPAKEK